MNKYVTKISIIVMIITLSGCVSIF